MQEISLNIVMTYPVYWSKYQVIRDFVQNFYDSVGRYEWKKRFVYHYDEKNKTLTMEITNIRFSYEWLLHIGASTKTNDESFSAGYFGEGFKIASLCALRDFKWDIVMSSYNWKLAVKETHQMIDNQCVRVLAYNIEDLEEQNRSRLDIGHFFLEDYQLFLCVLDSFYYPENKLLGSKIWEGNEGAIYERSDYEMNGYLPVTYKFGTKGAVFCGFQMLGTNPFPLVFCLHDYEKKDRERRTLYEFETIKVILQLMTYVPAEAAIIILEKMQVYWGSYPKKKREVTVDHWGPVVNELIRRIHSSDAAVTEFRKRHPDLLCVANIKSRKEQNLRKQAKAWLSLQPQGYKLVTASFCLLGYEFLETLCERNDGFAKERTTLNQREEKCAEILENIVKKVFGAFFPFHNQQWPAIEIITNQNAVVNGIAALTEKTDIVKNTYGFKQKYDLHAIRMKEILFEKEQYSQAVSTYVHELCHVFGGDSSSQFSLALTKAIEILLNYQEEIEKAKKDWIEIFDEGCSDESI